MHAFYGQEHHPSNYREQSHLQGVLPVGRRSTPRTDGEPSELLRSRRHARSGAIYSSTIEPCVLIMGDTGQRISVPVRPDRDVEVCCVVVMYLGDSVLVL